MKSLGIALVAVLIALSGASMPLCDADSYELDVSVGDYFSYEPLLNLSETEITVTGNAMSFLTFDGKILEGEFTQPGVYFAVIEAVWTHGTLTQTATQVITFNVSSPVSLDAVQVYDAEISIEEPEEDVQPVFGFGTISVIVAMSILALFVAWRV